MDLSSSSRRLSLAAPLILAVAFLRAQAQTVPVRAPQGTEHGFLSVQDASGKVIGYGDALQTVRRSQVTSRLILHFRDGSLYDETTVYTQARDFHFLSDHLTQRGPLFPSPIDLTLTAAGDLTVRSRDAHGANSIAQNHLTLPPNIANGMIPVLLLNLPQHDIPTDLSMVVPHGKGRLVTLKVTPDGAESFFADSARHTAEVLLIHPQLGGIAGVIAPLLDKQPPDSRLFYVPGEAPQFVRLDTQLAEGGPLLSIRLAGLTFPSRELAQR